jgi:hypothetical protein
MYVDGQACRHARSSECESEHSDHEARRIRKKREMAQILFRWTLCCGLNPA